MNFQRVPADFCCKKTKGFVWSRPQMPFHDSCVKREKTGAYRRIRKEPDMRVKMVHPARFELTTYCSGGNRSIQLSYGCGKSYQSIYSLIGEKSNRIFPQDRVFSKKTSKIRWVRCLILPDPIPADRDPPELNFRRGERRERFPLSMSVRPSVPGPPRRFREGSLHGSSWPL